MTDRIEALSIDMIGCPSAVSAQQRSNDRECSGYSIVKYPVVSALYIAPDEGYLITFKAPVKGKCVLFMAAVSQFQ